MIAAIISSRLDFYDDAVGWKRPMAMMRRYAPRPEARMLTPEQHISAAMASAFPGLKRPPLPAAR